MSNSTLIVGSLGLMGLWYWTTTRIETDVQIGSFPFGGQTSAQQKATSASFKIIKRRLMQRTAELVAAAQVLPADQERLAELFEESLYRAMLYTKTPPDAAQQKTIENGLYKEYLDHMPKIERLIPVDPIKRKTGDISGTANMLTAAQRRETTAELRAQFPLVV